MEARAAATSISWNLNTREWFNDCTTNAYGNPRTRAVFSRVRRERRRPVAAGRCSYAVAALDRLGCC